VIKSGELRANPRGAAVHNSVDNGIRDGGRQN
jgi:hypothetical protein